MHKQLFFIQIHHVESRQCQESRGSDHRRLPPNHCRNPLALGCSLQGSCPVRRRRVRPCLHRSLRQTDTDPPDRTDHRRRRRAQLTHTVL